MADQQQLESALRRAHAAGDVEAARRLARALKASQVQTPPAALAAPARPSIADMTPAEKLAYEDKLTGTSLNPTDGMSGGDKFTAGNTQSFRNLGLGLVQSLSEGGPMASGPMATLRALGLPMPSNPVKEWADRKLAENAPADAALLDDGYGLAGNITGTVSSMFLPGATATAGARVPQLSRAAPALTAAGKAFMPTSFGGATAQGAVLGYVQPVAEGDSRTTNVAIGALGGAGGSLLPRVLGAGVRGVNRIREPLTTRGLENIAGRTLQRFATNPNIQQFADPVLGRAPTLAEATLDPGIAQLQRAAQSKSPEVASAIFNAQGAANGGRLAKLQEFAGTPAQRQTLMEAIQKAEKAAYAKVNATQGVDVNPVVSQIDSILAGPQGKRNAVRSALSEAREALFKADGSPETSADMLLGARGAIKDLIEGKGDKQAGKLAQSELIEVRDALDAAIRKVAPEIDAALDARRVGMRPVNEMDAMQELIGRSTADVSNPVTGGLMPTIRPAALMTQGGDLDRLAVAGTGFRKATGDGVFGPAAQDAIEGVRVGVARQRFADSAAKVPGSPTAQFLAGQNIMDGILGQPKQGSILSGVANLGAAALDKPYALIGVPERLNAVMARVLTDPGEAQRVLAKLPLPDRILIEQAIGRLSAPAGSAAASGQGG